MVNATLRDTTSLADVLIADGWENPSAAGTHAVATAAAIVISFMLLCVA